MKNICALLALSFLLKYSGFGQTTTGAFNPFGFVPNSEINITIAKDTTGMIWFAAYDSSLDSLFITNENNSALYGIQVNATNPGAPLIMADSRNDVWIINQGAPAIYRVHNSIAQQFSLPIPNSSDFGLSQLAMADNHHGLDYFLYQTYSATVLNLDSLYLAKFDGTNLVSMNLSSIINPADPLQFYFTLFCDYLGNVYVILDASRIYKYDGTSWTTIPVNFGAGGSGPDVFCSYSNQLLFDDHIDQIWTISNSGQLAPIYNTGGGNLLDSHLFTGNDDSTWMLNEWGLLKYTGGAFALQVDQSYFNFEGCSPDFGNALFDRNGNLLMTSSCYNNVLIYSFTGLNLINGTVFLDTNQNGVQDFGEVGVQGLNVTQSPNTSVANTDSNGQYGVIYIDSSQTHNVSFTCPLYYHLTTPSSFNFYPDTSSLCCYNFGIAPNGLIQDLQIYAASPFAVTGFTNYQWLSYQNNGTITTSDTVTYILDPQYTYVGSYPTADVVQGNVIKWAYSNLQPFETRNIFAQLQLDSNAVVGSVLNDTAIIGPVTSDTTPANNVYVLQQTVYSSFDPNQKTVSPAGPVNPGDVLTYTIYFQNTGTAPAINVVVNDTLDPNLNFSTFKIIGYSNPVTYQVKGNGIVQFTFSNIQLPDSADNPAGSIGYVRYSVQADNNLAYGSDIHNTGYINFDFNPAVVTNTTTNYYGVNTINEVPQATSQITIYPNPASDQLFIKVEGIQPQTISIYDVAGRLISTQPFSNQISIGLLSNGVYFVEVQSAGEEVRKRFIKMQ